MGRARSVTATLLEVSYGRTVRKWQFRLNRASDLEPVCEHATHPVPHKGFFWAYIQFGDCNLAAIEFVPLSSSFAHDGGQLLHPKVAVDDRMNRVAVVGISVLNHPNPGHFSAANNSCSNWWKRLASSPMVIHNPSCSPWIAGYLHQLSANTPCTQNCE